MASFFQILILMMYTVSGPIWFSPLSQFRSKVNVIFFSDLFLQKYAVSICDYFIYLKIFVMMAENVKFNFATTHCRPFDLIAAFY